MELSIEQGETLFANGDIEAAEKCFYSLLEQNPHDADVLNNLGTVHYTRGDVKKAENCFLEALGVKADYVDALLNLAELYQSEQRWPDAAAQIANCLGGDMQDEQLLNKLGMIYIKMNDTPKARSILEKSMVINPEQETIKTILNGLNEPVAELATPGQEMRKKKAGDNSISDKAVNEEGFAEETALTPDISLSSAIPNVSIGLPVYNGGVYLDEAIESIMMQDFSDFELIISDNNSEDETEVICKKYAKNDRRIRYIRQQENIGARRNFLQVLGLARAPYFMWASHDDLHERSFIGKCLEKIEKDDNIALVYPKTKMLDSDSKFLGIADDFVKAGQDDPAERFRHLIWEIGQCNMLYGLFRSHAIKQVKAWGKTLFGDNLLLAEIALMGKIVQISEPLFIRRFTRDYNYKSPSERNAQLISCIDPSMFEHGISLPHCRLTYAHLDLVNDSRLGTAQKEPLIYEIIKCFRAKFEPLMKYEIDRAVALISKDIYYCDWQNDLQKSIASTSSPNSRYYHISNLLKTLQEAIIIFPNRSDLLHCYRKCFEQLFLSKNNINATE